MNDSHRLGIGAGVVVAFGVIATIGAVVGELDGVAAAPQFPLVQGPEMTVYKSPT